MLKLKKLGLLRRVLVEVTVDLSVQSQYQFQTANDGHMDSVDTVDTVDTVDGQADDGQANGQADMDMLVIMVAIQEDGQADMDMLVIIVVIMVAIIIKFVLYCEVMDCV